jgi:hypothetical protein
LLNNFVFAIGDRVIETDSGDDGIISKIYNVGDYRHIVIPHHDHNFWHYKLADKKLENYRLSRKYEFLVKF